MKVYYEERKMPKITEKSPIVESAAISSNGDKQAVKHEKNDVGRTQTTLPTDPLSKAGDRKTDVSGNVTHRVLHYLQYLLGFKIEHKFSKMLNTNEIMKNAYMDGQYTEENFKNDFCSLKGAKSQFHESFYNLIIKSPILAKALVSGTLKVDDFRYLPNATTKLLLQNHSLQRNLVDIMKEAEASVHDTLKAMLASARSAEIVLNSKVAIGLLNSLSFDEKRTIMASPAGLTFYLDKGKKSVSVRAVENLSKDLSLAELLSKNKRLTELSLRLPIQDIVFLSESPLNMALLDSKKFFAKIKKEGLNSKKLLKMKLKELEKHFKATPLEVLKVNCPMLWNQLTKEGINFDLMRELPLKLANLLIASEIGSHRNINSAHLKKLLKNIPLLKTLMTMPEIMMKCLTDLDFAIAIISIFESGEINLLSENPDVQKLILERPETLTKGQFTKMSSLEDLANVVNVPNRIKTHFKDNREHEELYANLSMSDKKLANRHPERIPYLHLKEEAISKAYHYEIPDDQIPKLPLGDLILTEEIQIEGNPFEALGISLNEAVKLSLNSLDALFDNIEKRET